MKNLEFIKTLPRYMFVCSGSFAIKLQDKKFRDYDDIDIVIKPEFEEFVTFKAEKMWGKAEVDWNEYEWFCLARIVFDDNSRVDIVVLHNEYVTVEKDTFRCLDIQTVLMLKAKIMPQYEIGSDKFQKHLNDIWYFLKNTPNAISLNKLFK